MSSILLPRRRFVHAAAVLACGTLAAPARAADGWQPAVLHQARQRDITSSITGQQYRIFVSVPEAPAPAGGYPVVFALDGNASFPTLALLGRMSAWRGAGGKMAPVIVGIGYQGERDYGMPRGRDYTPPSGIPGDKTGASGGVEPFLDFIERELRPLIATLAPLDPARQALYGHSYGGLCTLYALFNRPGMFQIYLAASPSIWYGERAVLSGLQGFEQRVARLPARPALMLSVGELEQPVPNDKPFQGRDAVAAGRRMVDEARELAGKLSAAGTLSRVQFHLLAHENHGSASFPAMVRGLEFFLD